MTSVDTLQDVTPRTDEHGVLLLRPETEPVPEHAEHARIVDMIFAGLAARFRGRDDVAVHERLAWFPDRDDTRIRLDPDVMVVFGRPPAMRKSFKAWAEDGAAPTILIEVWSEDDTEARYRERLQRASTHGVEEVVLVHPFAPGGCRVTHLLADGEGDVRTVATSASADVPITIDRLGITMIGGPTFVVSDEHGPWADTAELAEAAQRSAAEARANAAEATAERARAERLAQALRDAGIDPDQL